MKPPKGSEQEWHRYVEEGVSRLSCVDVGVLEGLTGMVRGRGCWKGGSIH